MTHEKAVAAANDEAVPLAKGCAPYVELCVRSHFSFLLGASSPQALIERAHRLGYDAIALTDRDGLYGMVRADEAARAMGVRLIVGSEVTVATSGRRGFLSLYVENQTGYRNLCQILTESHRTHPKGRHRKKSEQLPRNSYAEIALEEITARASGLWCVAHESIDPADVMPLKDAFGTRLSLSVYRRWDGHDRTRIARACALFGMVGVPIVATNAVCFAHREDKPVLDVLHAIREGFVLSAGGRAFLPNTEACLLSPKEMAARFSDYPSWIARTRELADACRFSIREIHYQFPFEIDAPAYSGESPQEALHRLTWAGARQRYDGNIPDKVCLQLHKELDLIARLNVAPYFLSVHSIVEMARARDILCQGRGSAANSAVCFVLGMTAVDPARSHMLFERFLSLERKEPPDIDIDFEHERREEIIQAIYDKFGRDRAAMVSEVVCYRGRSALREAARVFGFSQTEMGLISGLVDWGDSSIDIDAKRAQHAGFDPMDSRLRWVFWIARKLSKTPRHLSVHVGGFVLSATPLFDVAPIEPATMPGRTVIPWDKDDLDALGFFKVDILGLGALTAIRKTFEWVSDDATSTTVTRSMIDRLARIPPEDPKVYQMLSRADAVGVFQVESRAQMSMLPRLRPQCFYDLVIEVAIIRPGPIQGGMVHPYLRRRNGEEACVLPHPSLASILERTLGVPLFQEQVMQIAISGAGYTPGEADQLRRDMATWRKNGRLELHRERLVSGFLSRGISVEFADGLFAQIRGFGEYGFPESHAASFALLVYASAYLKLYCPAAFAAALINSQPMGFYTPNTILQDARRHGVEVQPIDVTQSEIDCTLCSGSLGKKEQALRLGLRLVRGLGKNTSARIVDARKQAAFSSIADVAARADLNPKEVWMLAKAGAFDTLVADGKRSAQRAEGERRLAGEFTSPLPNAAGKRSAQRAEGERRLAGEFTSPLPNSDRKEAMWQARAIDKDGFFRGVPWPDGGIRLGALSRMEQLSLDFGQTGISVRDHPMNCIRDKLSREVKDSKALNAMPHGAKVTTAGLVICRQQPVTAKGVVFVTLEDEFGFINLILYSSVYERFRHVVKTEPLVLAKGRVERQNDVMFVVVSWLKELCPRALGEERDGMPEVDPIF